MLYLRSERNLGLNELHILIFSSVFEHIKKRHVKYGNPVSSHSTEIIKNKTKLAAKVSIFASLMKF